MLFPFNWKHHSNDSVFTLAVTPMNSDGKPTIVLPPVRLPPRYTIRWAYLGIRGWLYLPVYLIKLASIVVRVGISRQRREDRLLYFFNKCLHETDYLHGGPGVLPDFCWWKLGIERDGSGRRPEHDQWVEYKLDGYGGIEMLPQCTDQECKRPRGLYTRN
jgi:hypothetical protein